MGGIAYVPKHEHEAMKAEIERLRAELRQCITEHEESANLLRGAKMFGCASLYALAAQRVRKALSHEQVAQSKEG